VGGDLVTLMVTTILLGLLDSKPYENPNQAQYTHTHTAILLIIYRLDFQSKHI
jgi:hypothetical protein